jgi:hypothetical protein
MVAQFAYSRSWSKTYNGTLALNVVEDGRHELFPPPRKHPHKYRYRPLIIHTVRPIYDEYILSSDFGWFRVARGVILFFARFRDSSCGCIAKPQYRPGAGCNGAPGECRSFICFVLMTYNLCLTVIQIQPTVWYDRWWINLSADYNASSAHAACSHQYHGGPVTHEK